MIGVQAEGCEHFGVFDHLLSQEGDQAQAEGLLALRRTLSILAPAR
jgi:hypothetical protein